VILDPCLLDAIIEGDGLEVVFQPIFHHRDDGWRLHGFEALTRGPRGTNMEGADVLFEYVRRKREESAVDRVCLARVLKAARQLGSAPRLSFNVHASTLGRDREFVTYLAEMLQHHARPASRFTVEIVEHAPMWGGRSFQLALDDLRALGVSVALDDVGLGNSNYRMILECRPDYFKVDRYLVAGASRDFFRRAVLRSIADLSGSFGALVVAEGLDDSADLQVALDEGIALAQGFLLCRPQPAAILKAMGLLRDAPVMAFNGRRALAASAGASA